MKVLALDISTKTGYAFGEISDSKELKLIKYGQCKQWHKNDTNHKDDHFNLFFWADNCFSEVDKLIQELKPDILVVEQTCAGSKNQESQRVLEWIHYLLVECSYNYDTDYGRRLPIQYYLTGKWRTIVGCKMTKEQKKQNDEVRKQNKKGIKIAKSEDGKRIGKVGKKHVNVMKANEYFGLDLKLKDNDISDALLLLKAYHLERFAVV